MTWVKKVALARISTSRNREPDCGTIFSIAARRWIRQGEKASRTGKANRTRQGSVAAHRRKLPVVPAGRRPMTWSRWSIAFRSGSRWAAVQRSRAVVTSTIGCVPPASPSSRAFSQPLESGRTTNASALRFRDLRRSSNPRPIASGSGSSFDAITITRISPSGIGSRRAAASSGWIQSSSGAGASGSAGNALMRGSPEVPASFGRPSGRPPGASGRSAPACPSRSVGRRPRRSAGPRSSCPPGRLRPP